MFSKHLKPEWDFFLIKEARCLLLLKTTWKQFTSGVFWLPVFKRQNL